MQTTNHQSHFESNPESRLQHGSGSVRPSLRQYGASNLARTVGRAVYTYTAAVWFCITQFYGQRSGFELAPVLAPLPGRRPKRVARKINAVLVAVVLALCLTSGVVQAQGSLKWLEGSMFDKPDRGWWWYPDPDAEKQPEPAEPPRKKLEDITDMAELREEIQRIMDVAIMNPTEENVRAHLEAQDFMFNKAALFTDVGRRLQWTNFDTNYTARGHPTANYALLDRNKKKMQQIDQTFSLLTENHAIVYFANGKDCAACDIQSPVLRTLSKETGMEVLAISLDGNPIPMFPEAKPDRGLAFTLTEGKGLPALPAMYLVNRDTRQAIPFAVGTVSASDIRERVHILTQIPLGKSY
jgi:conjugal transfer pilus assembly protein TraF